MSWRLFRWTWRLESPLFVGTLPAGSLNRCRLYVPARVIWGALTAELARHKASGFPDYESEGRTLRENARFTYLYPAEPDGERWRAWLPRYESRGLVWRREDRQDGNGDRFDREMRMRLLDARPATAIDPDSDSAEEGSLRETECVLPSWRGTGLPVAYVGYVFVRGDLPELQIPNALFLGGDTRYGLGRVRRVEQCTPASDLFGAPVNLNAEAPIVQSHQLLLLAHAHAGSRQIVGSLELLAGWDRTRRDSFCQLSETPLWTPGSRVRDDDRRGADWEICEDGIWRVPSNSG